MECYTTWLKEGIHNVTKISIEIYMRIKIFISEKASVFWEGIEQSSLIIEFIVKKMTSFVEGIEILVAFQVKLFLRNRNKIYILLQMNNTVLRNIFLIKLTTKPKKKGFNHCKKFPRRQTKERRYREAATVNNKGVLNSLSMSLKNTCKGVHFE